MPLDAILPVAAIVAAFGIFMLALALTSWKAH